MAYNVLLVEDEQGIADAFKKQLELIAGYTVEWCDNGEKAEKIAEEKQFDVILLDLVMPEFDGFAFLKKFRGSASQYNKTPVIVLTNVTSDDTKKEVEALGISKYVIKTDITPNELISVIEQAVKS